MTLGYTSSRSQRAINRWNSLSQEDVDASSLKPVSRVALREGEIVRWTSLKTSSLQVLSAARDDDEDDVIKCEWTNYAVGLSIYLCTINHFYRALAH